MKIGRVKTEKYHNYEEGDVGSPIKDYFKKGFWKRNDRKRVFITEIISLLSFRKKFKKKHN
jgi:hypothetical protein